MDAQEALEILDFVLAADEHVLGPDGGKWAAQLTQRFGDLGSAVERLLEAGQNEAALRLVGSLSRGAQAVGRIDEARSLIEDVLDRDGAGASGAVRARALLARGELAFRQVEQSAAEEATAAALAAAVIAGDERLAAQAHMNLARIAFRDGNAERIAHHAERMLELDEHDATTRSGAVHMLGWAAHTGGDIGLAISRFEENVENYRAAGNEVGMAAELANIGDLALEAGDGERAMASLADALELAVKTESRYLLPSLLASVAVLSGTRGLYAECLELAAAADAQYAVAGLAPDPGGGVGKALRRVAVETIGGDEAERMVARGTALLLPEAVELARNALKR